MKIAGTYEIAAPREQVWEALNDIEVLARVVPGCQKLEQTSENEYEGTVKVGIQSIRGTYNGKIRLEDIQPPSHYKLIAKGRGSNGVIDGVGTVDLVEQDGKTILNYSGDANIGGALASVGQRLIDGASKQLLNQSLKALAEQVATRNAPVNGAGAATEMIDEATAAAAVAAVVNAPGVAVTPAPTPAEAVAQASAPLPAPAAQPAFQPRAVELAEHEQLKPESVVRGMVDDFVKERPWLPWVVVAFLLGVLFGRSKG